MRVLTVIASYRHRNDLHLDKVVREWRLMPWYTDIVVLGGVRPLTSMVEFAASHHGDNLPRGLPFDARPIFADRPDYDLYVYSEDDVLITERNVRAFLWASLLLPDGEISGMIRYEQSPERVNFPDVHGGFHWDPSVKRGVHLFAHFTNEHAGCYLLLRRQLQMVIDSGGFLVAPHDRMDLGYGMLESGATDPYSQCGLKKMLCVSRLRDFAVHHLPNTYLHCLGTEHRVLERQIGFPIELP